MRPKYLPLVALVLAAGACDPAENVEVLPLPALERPSREARLGIPEVAGSWRFAGWEIVRGDTTALERTFPSFGELRLDTQRLDSIAGTFELAAGRRGVMGEVRRDGNLSLVTFGGGDLGSYITGRFASDTLWLELTSVLTAEEWPRDARAAFVRTPVAEPITWLRGARPQDLPPPVDSTALMVDSLGRPMTAPPGGVPGAAGVQPGGVGGQPGRPGAQPGAQPRPAAPRPGGVQPVQPVRPQPSGAQQPSVTQPRPAAPAPAPRPTAPPSTPRPAQPVEPNEPTPTPVRPAPAPAPAPAPEPEDNGAPPLLGDPVL